MTKGPSSLLPLPPPASYLLPGLVALLDGMRCSCGSVAPCARHPTAEQCHPAHPPQRPLLLALRLLLAPALQLQALLQAPKVDDLEALPRLAVAPELALAALPWVRAWAWPQELAVGLAGLAFAWAHAWAQLASALGLAQHSQAAQQEPPSVAQQLPARQLALPALVD